MSIDYFFIHTTQCIIQLIFVIQLLRLHCYKWQLELPWLCWQLLYWHIVFTLETETHNKLREYITERSAKESAVFFTCRK